MGSVKDGDTILDKEPITIDDSGNGDIVALVATRIGAQTATVYGHLHWVEVR
mgnify:CR=1 FL=1|jgi:hypothetical protein